MKSLSMGRLWHHEDFMRLWVSQTIEAVGGEVTNLALPTVAILLLNAGAMDMGILNGLQMLPVPVLGVFVGVWADRWRRRPMMVAANLGRMLTLLWVPLAFIFGILQLHQLFIVATLLGIFTVFFDVANQSYLPSLIERGDLIEGNSKIQTTQSGAQVVGPALGGFLIKLLGAAQAFAVEAFGFLCSALMIFSIRKPEAPLHSNLDRNFVRELKEGGRIVFSNPVLRSITACTAMLNFGAGVYFAVVYLFLYDQLSLPPETVGLIFTLGAVGFVVGALTASKAASVLGLGPSLAVSIIFQGICLALIPFAVYGPTIPLVGLFLMLSNVGIPIYNINQVSLRQAITPDHIQGRMNATVRSIIRGTLPLGSFIGGILGTQFGIFSTLVTGAALSTVGVIFLFIEPVRSLREIPTVRT
ncbi:MAG: MFS transporter [Candidatus Bathyarchaeia archaeon]|jgi:predicted MFS family arabinose efflux permease